MTRKRPILPVPFRHSSWRILLPALLANVLSAANPSITLQVSSETAPPSGYAQFKISLTSPALISTAGVSMAFDPTIFGPIANVSAFSSTGDQVGYVNVNGQQMTASFASSSAGLGQLAGVPVFTVTIPVLATATPAATSSITVDPTESPWQDQQGNTYTVSVNPGTFTVGGTLSVESVTPGGGLLPSGTVVAIAGTGFDATTTVTIDGVSLASTQLVSAQQINVTLGGATDLTAKHLHVLTGSGAQSDFFCALPSAPANIASNFFPILPFTTYTNVSWSYPDDASFSEPAALLNQTVTPVTVTFFFISAGRAVTVSPSIIIPPGELYLLETAAFAPGEGALAMVSSAPIRMMEYQVTQPITPARYFPPTLLSAVPNVTSLFQPTPYPSAATWTWQIGSASPSPITIDISAALPLTATISSAPWLTASAPQGTDPTTLTLTPNVSSLAAGTYSGTVTIQTILPASLSSLTVPNVVIPVTLQVSASPFITASGTGYLTAQVGSTTQITGVISVASSGTTAQFSTSVTTTSGGNWLSATPTTGATPGVINIAANPSGLPAGTYQGNVVIQGPANTITFSVEFVITAAPSTTPTASPSSLSFALATGTQTLTPQTVLVQSTGNFTFSVQTQSGGNWLTAFSISPNNFEVNASAIGLATGTYLGTITLTSTTNGSLQIPVTLVVLPVSAPLNVTPATVSLTAPAGQSITQTFKVTSSPSVVFNVGGTTPGAEQWISGGFQSSPNTPATATVNFLSNLPGTHYGTVPFTAGSDSVVVPVMLTVTASAASPPILASVVSAGSGTPSAISPGDIITLYGTGLASTPAGLTLSGGKVSTTLSGTQVMIGNIAAPLIYASSGQLNAIVPFEASGAATTVQVITGGLETGAWTIPLAPSAPSIFTISATGVGQGAIVNQDGSINSASNPATRGTAIQIYATGGGQTSPLSSTGSVAPTAATLSLPYSVTIGGANAQVLYAGSAPSEVEGVVQINVIVPQGITPGAALPVLVTIGGVVSQAGVTVSIQ
ncbi:MAG: hypothetical protein ABSF22_24770 [Bryobacteraceae bacterium]